VEGDVVVASSDATSPFGAGISREYGGFRARLPLSGGAFPVAGAGCQSGIVPGSTAPATVFCGGPMTAFRADLGPLADRLELGASAESGGLPGGAQISGGNGGDELTVDITGGALLLDAGDGDDTVRAGDLTGRSDVPDGARLLGGPGDDLLEVGPGRATIDCGPGSDILRLAHRDLGPRPAVDAASCPAAVDPLLPTGFPPFAAGELATVRPDNRGRITVRRVFRASEPVTGTLRVTRTTRGDGIGPPGGPAVPVRAAAGEPFGARLVLNRRAARRAAVSIVAELRDPQGELTRASVGVLIGRPAPRR
jgi:hypothetical protein